MMVNWDEEYLHDCSTAPPLPPKDGKYGNRDTNGGDGAISEQSYYEPYGHQSANDRYYDNLSGPNGHRSSNNSRQNEKQVHGERKQKQNKVQNGSLLRNLPLCKKCTRPVYDETDGYEVPVLGGWFHPNCFTCSHCECSFDEDRPFVPHNGKAYCEQHYEQLFLPNCQAW